ncbi:hypothetical protein VTL71DRAFT_11415 [Oculimacula yallundae]|uniref:Uncharacterized protein n=1 Tax=Oculimacula yallundae TaxID=86028 RepID=A0ABR4CQI4_9HELO
MSKISTSTIPADFRSRTRVGNKHDILGDGFIRLAPKTHDISLVGEHIPDIAHLAADLQVAVNAGWSRRHDVRYSKVQVLLLKWKDDDLGVETELKDLGQVFGDLFHYGVDMFDIPSEKPDKALKRRVFDFLENDGEDTLLILYYAGHAKLSVQANEAPVWVANRQLDSPSLPSGGIQSMFEEADADVLLLYDCCNSAATATSSSTQRHKGVTEVIAACGYETIAPEVGEHSFSNALTEVLAAASKGRPFSVAELHTKILTRLKCWTPSFVKDEKGKRREDHAGRLLFERQPRRTPIYSIICETEPRRSVILAPLKLFTPEANEASLGSNYATTRTGKASASESSLQEHFEPLDQVRKRKRAADEGFEYPQVLLAIRLDRQELDIEAWKECLLRQLPPEAKDIKIEGIYGSFSTLLLLRLPLEVWDLLPQNHAYSFVGFVTTENMNFKESSVVESAENSGPTIFQFSQPSSSGKPWGSIPLRQQSRETTPISYRFSSMSPSSIAISPPLSDASCSEPPSPIRGLSPVPEHIEFTTGPTPSSATGAALDSTLEYDLNDGEISNGHDIIQPTAYSDADFGFIIEDIQSDNENVNEDEIIQASSYSDVEETEVTTMQGATTPILNSDLFANSLNCQDDDADEDDRESMLSRRRSERRSWRRSNSSVQKRTISESIGSDTDDEDLLPTTFLDANEIGSSARRLRRRTTPRASLIFDDPPPRIEEVDEPESGNELAEVEGSMEGQEAHNHFSNLPYFSYVQEDDSDED